jgi:O-antigen/teichoic acid export membrane protein
LEENQRRVGVAEMERSKNTVRNIGWGFIYQILTLLLPFIIRTIILHILGEEYLGLNSLFASILSVLNMAELGFSSAIVFSMYEPIAKDDKDTICALMAYYRRVYAVVGFVVLALGLSIMPFLDKLIKGSHPADINLYILYGIAKEYQIAYIQI